MTTYIRPRTEIHRADDIALADYQPGDALVFNAEMDGLVPLRSPASLEGLTAGKIPYFDGAGLADSGISVDSGAQLGDVAGGNAANFDAAGFMTFEGAGRVLDDLLPMAISFGFGSSEPDFSVYAGNMRALEFPAGALTKEIFAGFQMPHGREDGTDVQLHLHLHIPDNVAGGDIKFHVEYHWDDLFDTGAVVTTTTTAVLTRLANAGIAKNYLLAFPDLDGTGKGMSSVLDCRVYRDPTDAEDTFGASVWLKALDAHVIKNALGSKYIWFTDIPASESLALQDFYYATDGPNWTVNDGWVPWMVGYTGRAADAVGVTVVGGRVTQISLPENGLSGAATFVGLPLLESLNFHENPLTSLNFSANPLLEELLCRNSLLDDTDVSANPLLRIYSCHNSRLTSLNFSANSSLILAYCHVNQLTTQEQENIITGLYADRATRPPMTLSLDRQTHPDTGAAQPVNAATETMLIDLVDNYDWTIFYDPPV